jgi:hypothetical protein
MTAVRGRVRAATTMTATRFGPLDEKSSAPEIWIHFGLIFLIDETGRIGYR